MLNSCVLMGRLTHDPELRHTRENTPVCSFTIAVARDGKSGETDFIDCVAWKGLSEIVARNFTKGMPIVVQGRLQIRSWSDINGVSRRVPEIVAQTAYFAGDKRDTRNSENASQSFTAPEMNEVDYVATQVTELRRSGGFDDYGEDDDDCPF